VTLSQDAPDPLDLAGQRALWVAVPPGWIEFKAHRTPEEARRWFAGLVDLHAQELAPSRQTLEAAFEQVREAVSVQPVDAAGAVVTVVDDRATLWQYTLTLVDVPESGDINVMAVIERYLHSAAGAEPLTDADVVEEFVTTDGRDGMAVHTSVAAVDAGRLLEHVAHARADQLGVVHAAVPVRGQRRLVAMITGVAPTVEERPLMAMVAAQMADTVQLRALTDAPPAGRVDVDTTGLIGQTRST
jgi:hypothetical protein